MHIVFVTPEFVTEKGRQGGLATYVSNLSRIFAHRGHCVTVITLSNSNKEKIVWENNITVERINTQRKLQDLGLFFIMRNRWAQDIVNSLFIRLKIMEINKQHAIDIVQYTSYMALGLMNPHHIKGVVSISSENTLCRFAHYYEYNMSKCINKINIEDMLEYIAYKHADGIFSPSKVVGYIIGQRTHTNIPIIETPFMYPNKQFDMKTYDKYLKGKKYFLTHTSLSCLKGIHIIGNAIYDILDEYQDIYFVFIGQDAAVRYKNGYSIPSSQYVQQKASKHAERVIFIKNLSREQLFPIIKNAFACIQPSRIDNLPNACIEAMAMEKIVIGTMGASFEQLIKHKINGLLIKRDSVKGLQKAIKYILHLDDLQKREMEMNAARTIERLAPEKIYKKLLLFYESVLYS